MQRLPSLVADDAIWRLPLSAATASELSEILLLADPDSRRSRLIALMSEDASLALWAVCRAAKRDGQALQTLRRAAFWLEENSLCVLRWPQEELTPEERTTQSQNSAREFPKRAEELAALSVAVALTAAELAQSDSANISNDENYFLGLLHNACDWLSMSGQAVSAASRRKSGGIPPLWLLRRIRQIEKQAERGPASAVVKALAAISAAKGPAAKGALAKKAASKKNLSRAASAAARWRIKTCHGDAFLPQLVERLASLHKLQEQFEQVLEQEKMAAMKELAYGASHEINNPLANIANRAQLLLREETDPQRRRMLAAINTQAFRATEMISDLMLFAKPPRIELRPLDLCGVVRQVFDNLASEARLQGTKMIFDPSEATIQAIADDVHLSEALRALCLNSLEAIGSGGCVEAIVQRSAAPAEHYKNNDGQNNDGQNGEFHGEKSAWVEIVIRDNGPGIPQELRRRLFDPYFSGREAGRGLGLGLSKCWRIVAEHHGRIIVESSPRGAAFTIVLPEATAEAKQNTR